MAQPACAHIPRSAIGSHSRAGALLLVFGAWLSAADAVRGQNLIVNPDFNSAQAQEGWEPTNKVGFYDNDDADSCPGSLGLLVYSSPDGEDHLSEARQSVCIPVTPGEILYVELTYASLALASGFRTALYMTPDCSGPDTGGGLVAVGTISDGYRTGSAYFTVPASHLSLKLSVFSFGDEAHTLGFDRAYVGRAQRVFEDDFEGGSECRWDLFQPGL